MNSELRETRLRRHGSTKNSVGGRPHDYSKSAPRLDGRTCRRKTGLVLLGEELHSQRQGTATGHSQNVPRPPNGGTPWRVRDIQLYLTALLVAWLENLC